MLIWLIVFILLLLLIAVFAVYYVAFFRVDRRIAALKASSTLPFGRKC